MTVSFDAAPNAADAAAPTSGQRIHEILGISWMIFWLVNLVPYADRYIPFNAFYVVIAFYVLYFMLTRPALIGRMALRPVFILWVLSALIPLLLYMTSRESAYAYVSMRTRVVNFAVVAGSGILLLDATGPTIARRSALLALAIIVPMNLLELVVPNIWSTAPGRSAGFFENPNVSGSAIIVCTLLAVDFSRHTKQGLFIVTVALAGIITTFSRSAMLFGGLLAVAYIVIPQGRDTMPASTRIAILASGSIALALALIVLLNFASLDEQASGRLLSLVRADYLDSSSTERVDAARYGLTRFLEHFWTGRGLGSPEYYDLRTHNSFIHIAVEYGIMGLLLYCTILFAGLLKVVQFGWRAAVNLSLISLFLIYYSIFDHYVHVSPTFAVAFAIIMTDALVVQGMPVDEELPDESPALLHS